jgi:hypothetical protein
VDNKEFIFSCFKVSLTTAVLLVVLEFLLWDKAWKEKIKKKENWELYKQGIETNLVHYFIIGPLAYGFALTWVHRLGENGTQYPYIVAPASFLIQAVGYALAHSWMHKPSNYWIHKFHHRYNEKTFVRPISANSVTLVEFCVAYVAPILTALIVCKPNTTQMYYLTMAISFTNLMIHTPLDYLPMEKYLPDFFVTNAKHFHHHEKNVRKFYSAPIIDLDKILGLEYEPKKGE